jgi:hypothetical protein
MYISFKSLKVVYNSSELKNFNNWQYLPWKYLELELESSIYSSRIPERFLATRRAAEIEVETYHHAFGRLH